MKEFASTNIYLKLNSLTRTVGGGHLMVWGYVPLNVSDEYQTLRVNSHVPSWYITDVACYDALVYKEDFVVEPVTERNFLKTSRNWQC